MKADNLRKRAKRYDSAIKKANERRDKGFFEGAGLAYVEASNLLLKDEYFLKTRADCLNNAGLAYKYAKKLTEAETYLQQALKIREKILGTKHLDTATVLSNLGNVYHDSGLFDKSEEYHQLALVIRSESDINHPDIVQSLNNLGSLYADKKDFDKANKYFQSAKSIVENTPLEIENDVAKIITRNYQNLQQEISRLERENLEQRAALHQADRLAYLGRMATMMAHNMNQPIGVLRMAASGALSDINDNLFNPETEIKPLLEKILAQTERLNLIMSNFRHFARGDRTILTAVNLKSVIEDIYQLLFIAQYQMDKIELTKELSETHSAHANEFALQEMLISLLSNARAAVKDKAIKKIAIKTWQSDKQVGFCVEDSGDGISEENLPKLFTPFLTSKNEGMGLGLYFCREIAKDLGGAIEYYHSALGGAGFKIILNTLEE